MTKVAIGVQDTGTSAHSLKLPLGMKGLPFSMLIQSHPLTLYVSQNYKYRTVLVMHHQTYSFTSFTRCCRAFRSYMYCKKHPGKRLLFAMCIWVLLHALHNVQDLHVWLYFPFKGRINKGKVNRILTCCCIQQGQHPTTCMAILRQCTNHFTAQSTKSLVAFCCTDLQGLHFNYVAVCCIQQGAWRKPEGGLD